MESRLREQRSKTDSSFQNRLEFRWPRGCCIADSTTNCMQDEAGTTPCFRDKAKNSAFLVYDAVACCWLVGGQKCLHLQGSSRLEDAGSTVLLNARSSSLKEDVLYTRRTNSSEKVLWDHQRSWRFSLNSWIYSACYGKFYSALKFIIRRHIVQQMSDGSQKESWYI